MDAQVQFGRRCAPRVPAKMAAVLAVALLLLYSSVQSSAQEVQATVSQVKVSDSPSTSNGNSTTVTALTTTPEGSSATHSAVLANQGLEEQGHDHLVLVDLARGEQEDMSKMTVAPITADSVPPGLDTTFASPLTQDGPSDSVALGPDSAYSEPFSAQGQNLTGPDSAEAQGGHLVPDMDMDIGSSSHNSQRKGYGVVTSRTTNGDSGDFSYSAYGEENLNPVDAHGGHLVPNMFLDIGSSSDNSQPSGYGVPAAQTTNGDSGDYSYPAYGEENRDPVDAQGGHLVSNMFMDIGSSQDNSQRSASAYSAYGQDDPVSNEGYALSSTGTYRPMPAKPAKAWRKGRCTFYGGMDAAGTMSGACGYGNLYASGYGTLTAALSAKLFNNGMACGACYEIACSGRGKPCKAGSIVVTATNFCPPNPGQSTNSGGWCNLPNEHFDLSYPAFNRIADPTAGVVPLQFRRVPCKKLGGIRFTLNGNCNFNLVTITNVGGSGVVIEAYMKADNMKGGNMRVDNMDWAPMSRSWGVNWQCSRNYCGKGISIKIVTSDKKVSISRLAGSDWRFGTTYVGQQVS